MVMIKLKFWLMLGLVQVAEPKATPVEEAAAEEAPAAE